MESTKATIALTKKAADEGADAVLVLTPHYYKPQMTIDVLRAYFEEVANASPIPIYLYSVPVFTGIPFPAPLAKEMAKHPNVKGMKESSGDLALMSRILATVPQTFEIACGSATVLYPALCLGAQAGILAVACCAPKETAAVYTAQAKGDHEQARKLQRALTPLATAVTQTYGVPGLKLAMDLAGLKGGSPRRPLLQAPAAAREELSRLLEQARAVI